MTEDKGKAGIILVVDDNPDILTASKLLLKRQYHKVLSTDDPFSMTTILNENYVDVVLLDMNFSRDAISGKEGLYWLKQINEHSPNVAVVLMTAYADVELAVSAVKAGAADFITKPWKNHQLEGVVAAAYGHALNKQKITRLTRQKQGLSDALNQAASVGKTPFLGESPAMQSVFKTIDKAAQTDANILITGESGTGKELVARAVHQASLRRDSTFIGVDMGAIPRELFESEFFGHKKGAFTDAKADKVGRFELAHSGSLFLDELGNLPLQQQTKLLAAIQNRQITPVGGNQPIAIDIRLICATNHDLHQQVDSGQFRQDLLYRINTVEICLPPLRQRTQDIPILTEYYLNYFCQKYDRQLALKATDMDQLIDYRWPGNVRELCHAIERAVILSEGEWLQITYLIPDTTRAPSLQSQLSSHMEQEQEGVPNFNLDEQEQRTIHAALKYYRGNVSQAAKALGLTRGAMYRRLEKYDL